MTTTAPDVTLTTAAAQLRGRALSRPSFGSSVAASAWVARLLNLTGCSRSHRPSLLSILCLLVLLATSAGQALAAEALSEAQIKAAYLYNFAKFVEWPATGAPAGAEINLCVIGNNVLEGAVQALDGRKAGERGLKVSQRNHTDASFADCQLLYIGSSEQPRVVPILKNLGNAPVLTLSDIGDFAEKGGAIALLFRDNKVVFEVNLESIRNAGLRLPGQLLNIATHVYGR
ncbi:YfiR family protein [Methylomonas sp. EFPC3]|uniref:YfiR family protein n=1 Tax=Methylomonas sp. EFPC3 TaxID=3021710 RepID=UPI0024163CD7|nr:YfiR family protein [Methylomonas sp. EFPC3]WFP49794.1 YfiR family protein [Methylomonas sp. EFPC3]